MKNETFIPSMNSHRPRRRFLPVLALALTALTFPSPVTADDDLRRHRPTPELPSPACDDVEIPAGHRISAHVYALGFQIYRWDGASWAFVAPEAELFASPCYERPIGIHYGGPIWEANDGSKVGGVREAGCTAFPGAIPWLRLAATGASKHGRFARVTYIQRINTIGGTAPAEAGTHVGEEARVPYTAEYYFYRAIRD